MSDDDARARLWAARDPDGNVIELWPAAGLVGPANATALLSVIQRGQPPAGGWLELATARGLRDALNLLLLDDNGSGERAHPQATVEGWQAFHDAEHRQLSTRAMRIGQQLAEHTTALAQVAGRAREAESAREQVSLEYVAEVVHLLAVQQQRVAASLGDLLSALAGEP